MDATSVSRNRLNYNTVRVCSGIDISKAVTNET